ncbi:MAG: PA14 domain-containing protein [Marinagarivorans sp.]|nr:PA14 domain-containing protein [Marinagarivorans sp.]
MIFKLSANRAAIAVAGLFLLSYAYGHIKYSSSGIAIQYYDGENFELLVETSISKNIYLDSNGKPSQKTPPDHFSIKYSGFLVSATTEEVAIKISSDDGVRLWVNDMLIVNDWTAHALKSHINTIRLNKGKNKLQLEYFNRTGWAKLDLLWKKPNDRSFQRVPTRALRYE